MNFQMRHHELSATEILSRSLSLYFSRLAFFLVPFLIANLANGALSQLTGYFIPDIEFPSDITEEFFLWLIDYLAAAIPVFILFAVIGWVLTTLSSGIAVKCSSDILERRRTSLGKGFSSAFSSIFPLLAVGFTVGILTILGLIVFIIPGIIIYVIFSLAVQAIIIERLGALESLRRSRGLVAGRWWKTFVIVILLILLTVIMYVIGYYVGDLFGGPLGTWKWIISSVVTSLAQPLQPIALTHLYYSLLAREKPAEPEIPPPPTVPVEPPTAPPPPPTLKAFQPRFCYKCGQKIPLDATYCPRCGVRVRS